MIEGLLEGMQQSVTHEVKKTVEQVFATLRKRVFSLVLQVIVFSASAIFLLLGFIFLADNFLPIEYVLLLFGTALLFGFLLGTK